MSSIERRRVKYSEMKLANLRAAREGID